MNNSLIRADRLQRIELPRSYINASGELTEISPVNRQRVCHQLQADAPKTLADSWAPLLVSLTEGQPLPSLAMTKTLLGHPLVWHWQPNEGPARSGCIFSHELPSLDDAHLRLDLNRYFDSGRSGVWSWQLASQKGETRVVYYPQQAAKAEPGPKLWGPAVQLYSLRGQGSWGMGDFGVLQSLIRELAPFKPGFIGLNPLHALDPFEPEGASPYSPSDRRALNPLYIDLAACPGWPEIQTWFARQQQMQHAIKAVQGSPTLLFGPIARLKYQALLKLFHHFEQQPAPADYVDFCQQQQHWLDAFARFFALRSRYGKNWRQWSPQVQALAELPEAELPSWLLRRIQMAKFWQHLASQQLKACQQLALAQGIPLGLYLDLAVGASHQGSEVWQNQAYMAHGLELGAPPDALAPQGQCWGLPMVSPWALEASKGQFLYSLLAANMSYGGALRIDHAMALFRVWAVPTGHSSKEGAYVPFDFFGNCRVLNQASQDHQCLVIAEDLGTVPDEVLTHFPLQGYRGMSMLIYEREGARLPSPESVKATSLAVLSSHDMPPLKSFWEGSDIDLRLQLGLIDEQQHQDAVRGRVHERQAILATLGLSEQSWSPELCLQLHQYLASTQAELISVQLEDMLMMDTPINVPGTSETEYSNWRRPLPVLVEDLPKQPLFAKFFQHLAQARPGNR